MQTAKEFLQFDDAKRAGRADELLFSELKNTQKQLADLTEQVKKKEKEEITFEIDPEAIRGEKGEDGKTPVAGVDFPFPKDGKDGRDGLDADEESILRRLEQRFKQPKDGKDGRDGKDGKDGLDGKNGAPGLSPEHEWQDTKLRFKNPDNTWGEFVDLRGFDGIPGRDGGGGGIRITKDSGTLVSSVAKGYNFLSGIDAAVNASTNLVDISINASELGPIVAPFVDHGLLLGLADDDHTQYALLAGRAGGQSLTGGTGAGESLTFNSTSDATKGRINLGESIYISPNSAYNNSTGILVFGNGSTMREQVAGGGGTVNRFFYQPFGDRMEILNLAGTKFIMSAHGDDSGQPNGVFLAEGFRTGSYQSTDQGYGGGLMNGFLGIGVLFGLTPVAAQLHVRTGTGLTELPAMFENRNSLTNSVRNLVYFKATAPGGNPVDGFGSQLVWQNENSAGTASTIAALRVTRDGGDAKGKWDFRTGSTTWMTADNALNVTMPGRLYVGSTNYIEIGYESGSATLNQTGPSIYAETGQKMLLQSGTDQFFFQPRQAGSSVRAIYRSTRSDGQSGFELGENNASVFYMRLDSSFDQAGYFGSSFSGMQFVFADSSNRDRDTDIAVQTDPLISVRSALNPNTDHSEGLSINAYGIFGGEINAATPLTSTLAMETDRAPLPLYFYATNARQNASSQTNATGATIRIKAGDGNILDTTAGFGGEIIVTPGLGDDDENGRAGYFTVAGAVKRDTTVVNAATYTQLSTDQYLQVTRTSTGTCAITLRDGADLADGWILWIYDSGYNASLNNITITPAGSDTINNDTDLVMDTDGQSICLQYNSTTTDWEVIINS